MRRIVVFVTSLVVLLTTVACGDPATPDISQDQVAQAVSGTLTAMASAKAVIQATASEASTMGPTSAPSLTPSSVPTETRFMTKTTAPTLTLFPTMVPRPTATWQPTATRTRGPTPTRTLTRTPTPLPTLTLTQAENEAAARTDVTFEDLMRTPDEMDGTWVRLRGEVVQVISQDSTGVQMRVSITRGEYFWEDAIFALSYESLDQRIMEEDVITFVGIASGVLEYETIFGETREIPVVYLTSLVAVE